MKYLNGSQESLKDNQEDHKNDDWMKLKKNVLNKLYKIFPNYNMIEIEKDESDLFILLK